MIQLTEEQLNNLGIDALILLVSSLQDQLQLMSRHLDDANTRLDDNNRQIELLTEHIRIMNQRHFGRKSESDLSDMDGQLTLFDSFNEVEATAKSDAPKPSVEEIIIPSYKRSKSKWKREEDLSGLSARIFEHSTGLRKKNLPRNFQKVTKNFLWESTSVSISFQKLLLWMNIMSTFMLPKIMTILS